MKLFVQSTLEALTAARQESDYYKISLDIIRYATPLEIAALADSKAILYPPFKEWLARLLADLTHDHKRIATFRYRRIGEALSLYTTGEPNTRKALIIGFCGGTHDLCAPTGLILQYFPERDHDVLVVRDMQLTAFTTGIPGYATPFAAAIERMRKDFSVDRYGESRCFGVSSGGAAALLAGTLLRSVRAISICGRPPTSSAGYGKTAGAVLMEEELRKSSADPKTLGAVFGDTHAVDSENARRLARIVDLTLMPIPRMGRHSIIKPMHKRGDLDEFFRNIGLLR